MPYDVLPLGPLETNCWLCWDENTRGCAVIDPGAEPEKLVRTLQEKDLHPKAILLTHAHFDHVGAAAPLARALNLPVYVHEADTALPERLTGGPLCFTAEYAEGDTVTVDGLRFEVLETPGHTMGSVCLRCGALLFTGDTLFAGACGRTDLGGSAAAMRASLCRLALLPGDYAVLPGHGPASTLDLERRTNPYLREALR